MRAPVDVVTVCGELVAAIGVVLACVMLLARDVAATVDGVFADDVVPEPTVEDTVEMVVAPT